MTLYRGDDTDAFNNQFIIVELENEKEGITKAEFRAGSILKTFENPTFPLNIELTSEETLLLKEENCCFLAVYDSEGRKQTCEGTLSFVTQCRKV